ncbi:serine/threonine protein phosphatase [Chlamydiales bacterium]|nr:serine/threonine protein phosphatase [Chlamydiales bacterium]
MFISLHSIQQEIVPQFIAKLTTRIINFQKLFSSISQTVVDKLHFFTPIKKSSRKAQTVAEKTEIIAKKTLTKESESHQVKELMTLFDQNWDSEKQDFKARSLSEDRFINTLKKYQETIDPKINSSFIEKRDLPKNSSIFMRSDIHGDLKSLLENLKTLQREGYLDQNFRCKEGFYLLFLGDYTDRGSYSAEIIELLANLMIENPHQVFLIRGNHEYLHINHMYGMNDPVYVNILSKHEELIDAFYNSMPLTLYLAEKNERTKEYIHSTHGMFDLGVDPSPLIDCEDERKTIEIPKKPVLSGRIKKMILSDHPLKPSAIRISELWSQSKPQIFSPYNWGDTGNVSYPEGDLGVRQWKLSPEDIKHYMRLSSDKHHVLLLFRGHQQLFQQTLFENELLVTTLPVGMDSPYKNYPGFSNQQDRAYLLKTGPKLSDWTKQAYLRTSGSSTTEVTTPCPIKTLGL